MKVLVYFHDSTSKFEHKLVNLIAKGMATLGHQCDIFGPGVQRVAYLNQMKSSSLYEEVLAISGGYDSLVIPRLHYPEYFYYALKGAERVPLHVGYGMFGHASEWRSELPSSDIAELLATTGKSLSVATMSIDGPLYEPCYDVVEPIDRHDPRKLEWRKQLGLSGTRPLALYYGTYHYGKGLDILLRALPTGMDLLIAGDPTTSNYDSHLDTSRAAMVWTNPPDSVTTTLFGVADVVVLPYRRSYEGGTSGVFVQAMQAHRPVVAPNFAPFNQLVWDYEVGKTFEPEDVDGMADQLKSVVAAPFGGRYDDYLKLTPTPVQLAQYYLPRVVSPKEENT